MATINIKITPEAVNEAGKEIIIVIDPKGITTDYSPRRAAGTPFETYAKAAAGQIEAEGRTGTAENYRCATRSFMRFAGDGGLTADDIDAAVVSRYEAYLKRIGLCMNTVSFYMRTLRAIYNMAVTDGMTVDRKPFRNVYTGVGKTAKRALAPDVIRRLRGMTPDNRQMALARDMFLFSLYTRGMSFVDMAYLKKTNLENGVLTYRRMKTGRVISVKWEKCMQDIIDAHPCAGDYMLPLVTEGRGDTRTQYKRRQREINTQLGQIAARLRLGTRLTMYVARHTWASMAKNLQIPMGVISEGLGHDSVKTTQIYIKSIGSTAVDRANAKILKVLAGTR